MRINPDLGHGGIGLQDLRDLFRSVADDLAMLKTAVVQLQGLTSGADAPTDLTLEQ